ncbi:MAG: glucose-6-phosphate dehydrogenase [Anaerolineales bacterium]
MGSLEHLSLEPAAIVIFGASGDLTRRKLVPALHSLLCEGLLPRDVRVLGFARSEFSQEAFSERLLEGVQDYARLEPGMCERWPEFAERISYLSGDYDDPAAYRRLGEALGALETNTGGNCLFYLAVPPVLYPVIVEQLGKAGLARSERGWQRIIIEKPFGHDLSSARELDDTIHAVFDENQVYRIDHYLGKETVQNILVFRFANLIFEPLWSRNYVDHVQITVAESVGVQHRAAYYDQAGVARDMLQNHILQILSLVAMEPPASLDAKALRDEKAKVLKAVRPVSIKDGVWGQYAGYTEEEGVESVSQTPTYVALGMHLDNWRWQGVPFYVRSGKRLAAKMTEITLQFKEVPHTLFPENVELPPGYISLYIQPNEGIHLNSQVKIPGAGMRTEGVDMTFRYGRRFGEHVLPDAYERLLLDAIQGDASLFARSDEIALAWELVDPLTYQVEPIRYIPGSQGPQEAARLMEEDRVWRPIEEHSQADEG